MSQPFIPNGEPLPLAKLDELAAVTPADLEKAIASAHPSIKPYLNAKEWIGNGRSI